MKKRTLKPLIVPLLAILMSTCMIQSSQAHYTTFWLQSDKDDFYNASLGVSGSFYYSDGRTGATYTYGISAGVHYWSFNHMDTSDSSSGTIRVAGAAHVKTPSGAPRSLGVLRVKTELRLHPIQGWWDWIWYREKTLQDGEINIRSGNLGAVNLAILQSGDARLRGILTIAASIAYSAAMSLAGAPFIPFNPTWITYLNSGSDNDWKAGPGFASDPDPDAFVEGRAGWQYPAWKTWCSPNAEVAYDFYYTYYRRGYVGWKGYELEIKVSADFGYVADTYQGTYRNVVVTTREFTDRWIVYVKWG